MDMQYKIRYQAEQQAVIMKDVNEFITAQQGKDVKAKEEAKNFDTSKVVLPGIRGVMDIKQDAEYKKQIGNQLFKEKKYEEAEKQYQEILDQYEELDKEFKANLYFNMALCCQKVKPTQYLTHESYFSLALNLQPTYQKARVNRAKVFMKQERWQDALNDFYESGRDQDSLQADIQQCITKIQEKQQVGKVQIEFDEDNEEEENEEKPVQKKQQVSNQVSYKPEYSIDPNTGSLLFQQQFFAKITEFEKFQINLSEFLNQFHSSVLNETFEQLKTQITVLQLKLIIKAILKQQHFTITKKLNTLYSISAIGKYRKYYDMFDESVQQLIQDFIGQVGKEQLTELQQERLDKLKANWK